MRKKLRLADNEARFHDGRKSSGLDSSGRFSRPNTNRQQTHTADVEERHFSAA
jgi:hypothetical protein